MNYQHIPVLLQEVIENLKIEEGKKYIDATLGGGGYTREILKKGGLVLGIDLDTESLSQVNENFKFEILNLKLKTVQGNFRDIAKIAHSHNFGNVSGVVFDLGLSSFQLDTSGRGFSFMRDEKLDMRMGADTDSITAADIINRYSQEDLYNLFLRGEEHFAKEIAHALVEKRREKKFETTKELAEIIDKVIPFQGETHKATKVFQALRMEVNQEFENLEKGITQAFEVASVGCRIAVVSFHSLEDRIVKHLFENYIKEARASKITKKPIRPTFEEIKKNRRARSAKLRVIERN